MYHAVNVKLARYGLEEMLICESTDIFFKVDSEWTTIIQALVSIIDL